MDRPRTSGVYTVVDGHIYALKNLAKFTLRATAEDARVTIGLESVGAPAYLDPDLDRAGPALYFRSNDLSAELLVQYVDENYHPYILGHVQSVDVEITPNARRVVIHMFRPPGTDGQAAHALVMQIAALGGIEIITHRMEPGPDAD